MKKRKEEDVVKIKISFTYINLKDEKELKKEI